MFVGLLSLSLLSFGAAQGLKVYNFIKVHCAEPIAPEFGDKGSEKKLAMEANTTEEAMRKCVNTVCAGFYYNDTAQSYTGLQMLYGISPRPEKFFYMYDKSNGTNLPNAPTWLDSKLIYSIYNGGSCPRVFTLSDSVCTRKIPKEYCEMFPEYTNATFDSNTSICTIVSRETLIAAWS